MANNIIDEKYRDTFGVNSKYEHIISSKLNDDDSYNAFKVLVNTAIKNLTDLIEGKIRIGLIEPGMYYKYYGYDKDYPNDCRNVFEGYAPYPCSSKELNQKIGNLYAASRLTKYVNIGLLQRCKYSTKDTYFYYLPYDFFTTNNPIIRFVPNDEERPLLNKLKSNF